MNPHYVEIVSALKQSDIVEKTASQKNPQDVADSCSRVYEVFLKRAAAYGTDGTPGDDALAALKLAHSLNSTSIALGEKVAADADAEDRLAQLAAVVYLDTTLKTASLSLDETGLDATNRLILLGREYGVTLLRGLVA